MMNCGSADRLQKRFAMVASICSAGWFRQGLLVLLMSLGWLNCKSLRAQESLPLLTQQLVGPDFEMRLLASLVWILRGLLYLVVNCSLPRHGLSAVVAGSFFRVV